MDTQTHIGDDDARAERVGQLLNEFLDRRARGDAVNASDLLAQHPDLAEDLHAHLDLLQDLRPPPDRIEDLVGRGILAPSADPRYVAELGPYKIVRFLGRGGMGIVLQAYEPSLNRTVALKVLRPDLVSGGASLARFEREAKAAAALHHPNIVAVHAIGQQGSVHYIAMEYVDGPSLAEVLAQARRHEGTEARSDVAADPRVGRSEPEAAAPGPADASTWLRRPRQGRRPCQGGSVAPCLSVEFIWRVFRELLAALDAAHRAGLIHRDVKSSNILLDLHGSVGPPWPTEPSAGEAPAATSPPSLRPSVPSSLPLVKLADFGLARMRSSQTQVTVDGSVLGTPEYMSPEQARGDADIDHRTDLYSAGVVLYEMLTGRTPFHCDTPTATLHRILHEEPRDPRKLDKSIDPVLASLALRLMAKRPENRLASAGEALAALGSGVRIGVRRRLRPSVRRTILLGAAVVLLGLLGWWARPMLQFTPRARMLKLRVTPDTLQELQVRYVGEVEWRVWPSRLTNVAHAQVLDLDGRGTQAVAAGLEASGGPNLVLHDARGRQLWDLRLEDSSRRMWPDCPRWTQWSGSQVAAGDLDGRPGDELIVRVARGDAEYPNFLTIVDPRTHAVWPQATFFHLGHLNGLWVLPDYFGPGRPAILACGLNNKLDGFDDEQARHEPQYAHWDVVTAMMILDPNNMDGVGPPSNGGRIPDLAEVVPYAYAFLDLPYKASVLQVDRRVEQTQFPAALALELHDSGQIPSDSVRVTPPQADDGSDPWILFSVIDPNAREPGGGRAILVVDRWLQLREVTVINVSGETTRSDYWRSHWRVLVHSGRYVDE